MDSAATLREASRYCLAGDWQRAWVACSLVLAAEPANLRALITAGEAAAELGRAPAARELALRAVRSPEQDPSLRIGLAQLLLRLKEPEAADRMLRALIARGIADDRLSLVANLRLGAANESLGRLDAALEAYEAARSRVPSHATADTRRSVILLRRAWGEPLPAPDDKRQSPDAVGRIAMSGLGSSGRFGNQLFQYAALRAYGKMHRLRVEVPEWIGRWIFDLDDPAPSGPLPAFQQDEDDDAFMRALGAEGPAAYANRDIGGFLHIHTRHLKPHAALFRTLFRPGARLMPLMDEALGRLRERGRTIVGIHLRRGDFRGGPRFWPAPSAWYAAWLKPLWRKLEAPVLYVASDDAAARGDFAAFDPVVARDICKPIPGAEMYPDFHILAHADLLAISNSSFSFAAGMLNQSASTFVRPDPDRKRLVPYDPWTAPGMLTAR